MDSMEKSGMIPNHYEKLSFIISQAIPKYLRQYFIERWNTKFPEQPWTSCNESGSALINAVPEKDLGKKDLKKFNEYKDKLHCGNEEEWSTDILVGIMIDFGLNMCDKSVKGDIVKLRKASSQFASCKASSPAESGKMIADITGAAKKLFQKDVEDEISKTWHSEIESSKTDEHCMQPRTEMGPSIESENVVESGTEQTSGKLLSEYSVSLCLNESPLILSFCSGR